MEPVPKMHFVQGEKRSQVSFIVVYKLNCIGGVSFFFLTSEISNFGSKPSHLSPYLYAFSLPSTSHVVVDECYIQKPRNIGTPQRTLDGDTTTNIMKTIGKRSFILIVGASFDG
jgi:hypothetical protein